MAQNVIRPLALGLLQRPDGALLLESGFDEVKNEMFYRLLGGGIEFGETGVEALQREFMEELGLGIQVEKPLGVNENIFTFNGTPGHQIILLYQCSFTDKEQYHQPDFPRLDAPDKKAVWRTPDTIKAESAKLYPEDIYSHLA